MKENPLRKQEKLKASSAKRLASYAAAGVAGAVAANTAGAALVIGTGSINMNSNPDGSMSWGVDLDSNGQEELVIYYDDNGGAGFGGGLPRVFAEAQGTLAQIATVTPTGAFANGYQYAQKFVASNHFDDSWADPAAGKGLAGAGTSVSIRDAYGYVFDGWGINPGSGFIAVEFYTAGTLRLGYLELSIPNPLAVGDLGVDENKPVLGEHGYETLGSGNELHFVPEPSSLSLLALGAVGIASMRRRKKA